MANSVASDDPLRADVEDLSPSAKLVFVVLRHEGECTQNELASKTALPQRTVRHAIEQLKEEEVVTVHPYIPDGRKQLYSLFRQNET